MWKHQRIPKPKGYHKRAKKSKTTKAQNEELTPEQLLSRAKPLINQSKEWIDSAVTIKEETVTKGVSLAEATGIMVQVKTTNKKQTLASLHTVTIAKLSLPSNEVLPVGTTKTVSTTNHTGQRARKVGCKICHKSFGSVKSLNDHHRSDHGIVKCENCDKSFASCSALDKHMYTHREMDFLCISCGKRFAF